MSSKRVKSPAFQVYPKEFLAEWKTLVMTTVEIGAYWLLLLVCWLEDGLPESIEELADLARMPLNQFQPIWEKHLSRCFQQRKDGTWTNNRLEKEFQKQAAWREKSADGGKASAHKRKQSKEKSAQHQKPTKDQASADQMLTNGQPDAQPDVNQDPTLQFPHSGEEEKKRRESAAKPRTHAPTRDSNIAPAIKAVREVMGRYPHRDCWDLIIKTIGDNPDNERMRECFVAWRSKDYKPMNLGWLTDWYINEIPAQGGPHGKQQTAAERNAGNFADSQKYLGSLSAEIGPADFEIPRGLLTRGS